VTWDLSRDKPRPRELGGPVKRDELKRVLPGEYIVHLSAGREKLETRVSVSAWESTPVRGDGGPPR
jgi:hypothetical protein